MMKLLKLNDKKQMKVPDTLIEQLFKLRKIQCFILKQKLFLKNFNFKQQQKLNGFNSKICHKNKTKTIYFNGLFIIFINNENLEFCKLLILESFYSLCKLYNQNFFKTSMGNMGNNRDTNVTAQTCWKELPFGFKCMFVGGAILTILQISETFSYYFFDNLQFFLYLHQIWRPFVAMLFSSGGFGIFNFLIAFLWLLPILPALEKQQSTIFLLVNIYVKNLVVQFAFLIMSFLLRAVTDTLMVSGGWFITIIIYLFLQSAKNPQQDVRFCWMPCLIKQKYIPWIMLVLIAMFGRDILGCLLGALLGYLEAFVLNGSYLIKLPVFVYTKLDYCVPDFIKKRSDYTKVSSCLANIRQNCCCTDNSASTQNNWQQNHVDNRSVQTNEAKVEVIGGGQTLGTSFKQKNIDPRSVWLKKAQEMQIQKQKAQINQKFNVKDQIQGVAPDSTNFEDDNDDNSVVNLAENDQQSRKRSEKELLD